MGKEPHRERRRCPDCGSEDHLYGRADIVWDPDDGDWRIGDVEDWFDCTECDWQGEERALCPTEGEKQ